MKIPVLHLEDGIHHFQDVLKSKSLQFYRHELYPYQVNIRVKVNKSEDTMLCTVSFQTTARFVCDRCLEEFEQAVDSRFRLLFHIGKDTWQTTEDEVVHIPMETVEVDINPWIFEYLILAIPMKMLCREDCKGLCPECGVNLNETTCGCHRELIDPRWEKLRELLK